MQKLQAIFCSPLIQTIGKGPSSLPRLEVSRNPVHEGIDPVHEEYERMHALIAGGNNTIAKELYVPKPPIFQEPSINTGPLTNVRDMLAKLREENPGKYEKPEVVQNTRGDAAHYEDLLEKVGKFQ